MGWAARLNPRKPDAPMEQHLRRLLRLFPDRETYEQWLSARSAPEVYRAHMERYLPDHLKAPTHG